MQPTKQPNKRIFSSLCVTLALFLLFQVGASLFLVCTTIFLLRSISVWGAARLRLGLVISEIERLVVVARVGAGPSSGSDPRRSLSPDAIAQSVVQSIRKPKDAAEWTLAPFICCFMAGTILIGRNSWSRSVHDETVTDERDRHVPQVAEVLSPSQADYIHRRWEIMNRPHRPTMVIKWILRSSHTKHVCYWHGELLENRRATRTGHQLTGVSRERGCFSDVINTRLCLAEATGEGARPAEVERKLLTFISSLGLSLAERGACHKSTTSELASCCICPQGRTVA